MHTSVLLDADVPPLPGDFFMYKHHSSTAIEQCCQSPSVSPSGELVVPTLTEDLSSEGALEDELIVAAFVICWPNEQCMTVR